MSDPVQTASQLFQTALAQMRAGEDAAAEATLRQVDALIPNDPAVMHKFADLANLRGDHAAAEDFLRRAHEAAPDEPGYRMLYGHMRVFRGDYAGGFPLFDAWRELPDGAERAAPAMPIPPWAGQSLAGKRLLIWGEEGLGDQIMYARFARELERRGASVVLIAPRELTRLFQEGLGVETVTAGEGAPVPGVVDYVVPSSRLPALLMPDLQTPPPAPYITPPPANAPAGARIGVVARGGPHHRNDARRSLDADSAARLLAMPHAISLTPDATGARDFHDTAAIVAGLDLVISVDTSVAHLAGALGKPLWILLPARGLDWRWGREGETSAWYGSARLFRQRPSEDWAATVDAVIAARQAGV